MGSGPLSPQRLCRFKVGIIRWCAEPPDFALVSDAQVVQDAQQDCQGNDARHHGEINMYFHNIFYYTILWSQPGKIHVDEAVVVRVVDVLVAMRWPLADELAALDRDEPRERHRLPVSLR